MAKVRNKSFIIMTFLSPLLMVGMVVLVAYLAKLNDSEKRIIAIVNESNHLKKRFTTGESVSYINFRNLELSEAKDSVASLGYDGLLYIPDYASLEATADNTVYYSSNGPSTLILERLEKIVQNDLRRERLDRLGVSTSQFQDIEKEFEIRTATFEGEKNVKGINELKLVIGGAFGYLIMMFIVIYGGFVMRSVIEEKTSRIIEVIISSVKPFQLMLGKIIGTSLAGITQFTIWIFSAGLLLIIAMQFLDIDLTSLNSASAIDQNVLSNLPTPNAETQDSDLEIYAREFLKIPFATVLISFVIYFLLGYLIYSSIYAAIGAAVDNETDTQQFIFPIIIPLILAIYVGFFSVFGNPHGPIAVGFSLFPLTSPIVMLMRLPYGIGEGGVPIWQYVTSLLILVVTFLGIVLLAAKIYRVGILSYGKKPTYRELLKWLKY